MIIGYKITFWLSKEPHEWIKLIPMLSRIFKKDRKIEWFCHAFLIDFSWGSFENVMEIPNGFPVGIPGGKHSKTLTSNFFFSNTHVCVFYVFSRFFFGSDYVKHS